jgi:hypothetical protein
LLAATGSQLLEHIWGWVGASVNQNTHSPRGAMQSVSFAQNLSHWPALPEKPHV